MDNKKKFSIKDRRTYNGLLIIIFIATLFFITIHSLETNKLKLRVGSLASEDIRATKDLEDEFTTKQLRHEAMNSVEPKYRIYPSIQMTMRDTIKDFLNETRDIKAKENLGINQKVRELEKEQNFDLSSKEVSMLIRMDYKSLNEFENNLMDLINHLMGNGIKESELEYEKNNLENTFESLNISEEQKTLGLKLISSTIEANEFLDKEETERKKNEAAENIKMVILKEGEIIAPQGTRISERELELIKVSGLLKDNDRIAFTMVTGLFVLIVLGIMVIGLYIYYFNQDILYNNKLLILLIIVILTIIMSKALYSISPYIMPMSATALLISILVDSKLALIINMFLTFFLGFILKLDMNAIIMYILGGSMGALVNIRQEQRYNMFFNGIIIGIINTLSLTSFGLARGYKILDLLGMVGYGFLGGIISSIITLGTLPIWENTFSILTPLKLLELSNPNQPLLKKLLLEAPGTYHHSILVGNLSEAAAEVISANPLMARVGAYYHDIGKTKRPYYFAENQFGMENPHNKLQAIQSAKIILSHPGDGIDLARKHRLPKEIIDIIDQHHGSTTVAYFYYKAREANKDIDIPIDEFKYKGRKPQTKEAAIVMLADSSEAAVRSIKDLTREKIEVMVRKVVKGKIDDKQLDESNINFREVELIINSFVRVLTGIYHDRIEYPASEKTGGVEK